MSAGSNTNGAGGRPTGRPPVYRRIRKLTPEELADVPPVRTKPIQFTGRGTGGFGHWKPGDPVGVQTEPSDAATQGLLDWALVSWARRHVVEEVRDYCGAS